MTNTDFVRYLAKSISSRDEESMYAPRGVYRSNMEDIVYEILKPFEINRNGTTFVPVRNSKPPELPDSYPKGDLDDLLGFDDVGNN